MNYVRLLHDDCKVAMQDLIDEGIQVDSIVTDPPYGLVSIAKRFGNGQAAAKFGRDGSFARLSAGFMDKTWDGSGIERDVEMWKLCLTLLKPGAHLLAMSSPRTGHRMVTAIEDAGFVIHPFIGWAYGTGFPKPHALDRAIDKHLLGGKIEGGNKYVPTTAEAVQWSGWASGAQVRKPALEPIYVAQKPFSEKSCAANVLKHGVGAVNIDGCRIPAQGRPLRVGDYKKTADNVYSGRQDGSLMGGSKAVGTTDEGRYPANLITDGSEEIRAQLPEGAHRFFECYPRNLVYTSKAGKADRAGSDHPTVKPIALMRSLVRHVTPPGGTVLDPFAGTGTTGEAAIAEGMNCILVEREDGYASTISERFGMQGQFENYLKLLNV